jgi:bis(5'-nucleosyl)-tetraphosphatase (symmetrical)
MPTYAIGDVQGCFRELQTMLALIRFDPGADRLWFVGDLVNRGPESLEVLRFVRELGERAVTILGNHDLHLVSLAYGFGKPRADDTLQPVLHAPDAEALIHWLRALPMLHVENGWVMVHAGLLPQWTVAQARALADEVEQALRGPEHGEFLSRMYGSRPDRWDDALRGADRLRVIVNAMTRLRFCTADGVMDFHAKGGAEQAPAGYFPWFDVPGRKSAGTPIACGHWSALGVRLAADLVALDSGCVWGGRLSALRLEDRRLFQVPCRAPQATDAC